MKTTIYLRYGRCKLLIPFFVAVSLMLTGILPAVEKDTALKTGFSGIDFSNGLLKVSVEKQPFQDVIKEVAEKTGIHIVISSPIDEEMTVSFDYLPIEDAIKQLLIGKSHVFFYSGKAGHKAALSQVLVLPESTEDTSPAFARTAGKQTAGQAKLKEETNRRLKIDREKLDRFLQNISTDDDEVRNKFYDALEQLQNTKGFEEMQSRAKELENYDEIKKVMEGMPDLENAIKQNRPSP